MEDNIMAESENEDEGSLNIALRTRSHLQIADFVARDNLDFPDVDMNLYQDPNSEGDTEYKKFLNQCYSEEIGNDTNTDDNDPEYVYNDDIFSHGWRFDLNEVTELNHEDAELYSNDGAGLRAELDQDGSHRLIGISRTPAVPRTKSPLKSARRKIDMFAEPEFARILNQQLRQHIQLLTQTFLLTKNTTNMRNEAEEAKSHLNSYMKIFKNKSKPSNLLPALDLVNNHPAMKDLRSSIRLSWRPLPIPESVKTTIRENPNVFVYANLLPQVAFSFLPDRLLPKKPKINFTINEDKLLAYALHEFKGESSPYAFIASLLMTAKTKTQISNHIKNIKRSPGNENNPIKLYYARGELPQIDLEGNSELFDAYSEIKEEEVDEGDTSGKIPRAGFKIETPDVVPSEEVYSEVSAVFQSVSEADQPTLETKLPQEVLEQPPPANLGSDDEIRPPESHTSSFYRDQDDLMNMDLDDLMAASTTISKNPMLNVNYSENKNIRNLKLKKSMLNLMSHNFLLSEDMGDLIIYDFLKAAQQKLNERNYLHLLQLLTDLMKKEAKKETSANIPIIYEEITKFLEKIEAPDELHQRVVLFIDLDQATKCGCAESYLHWMRFFQFMQHVELYHDGGEALEKKLVRLLDALQKDDPHKIKLAVGNLVNKHPFLKREFESLSLDEKPHPSLFLCEEDFDDVTEPISLFDSSNQNPSLYDHEHFHSKTTEDELSYASQSCPCRCHSNATAEGRPSQHCDKCNLKFMKGRMYLVNKIKPILAEWTYGPGRPGSPNHSITAAADAPNIDWTFEDDKEILEFCRSKAEQNEETVSFDTSTFEELVNQRNANDGGRGGGCKRSAKEIAERFNQLMEMYKDENSNVGQ